MERGELGGGKKQEEPSNIPSVQRGILMDTWEKPCRFTNTNNGLPSEVWQFICPDLSCQAKGLFPFRENTWTERGKWHVLPRKGQWKPSYLCFRNKVVLNSAEFQPISTLPLESQFPVALCISPCAKKVFGYPILQGISPLPLFPG